jgi:hypothetical protein
MLPIVGYRQLWSKDRNTLVQVFTDLETDLIQLVTIDTRSTSESCWESLTKVKLED